MSVLASGRTRWQRLPPPWRLAALAVLALWAASTVLSVVAAGTLPAREAVAVGAAEGFAGLAPPPADASGGELVRTGLVRFDALWYLAIAADGYPTTAEVPQAVAFFPGYPLAVAAVALLPGIGLLTAAQTISAASCIVALVGLVRLHEAAAPTLTGVDGGGATPVATRVVLVAASFPTAFFLLAPYAEAMFLATSVWALVLAVRGRPVAAAALAAVATATRPTGALLAVPLLLGVLPRRAPRWIDRLLPPAGSAAALAGMATFGWLRWGDPFAVATAQDAWQRDWAWPWVSLWRAVRFALQDLGAGASGYHLLDLLVLALVVVGLVTLVRLRQWPLLAHGLVSVLLWLVQPFDGRPLLSASRFALALPGVLLGLAWATCTPTRERTWLLVAGGLFAVHLVLFTRWWFVF